MRLRLPAKRTAALLSGALVLANFLVPLPALATEGPPSLDSVKDMIEDQTDSSINWTTTASRSARGALLRGTGSFGEDEASFTITCVIIWPPLTIRCNISMNITEQPPEQET